jgi:Pyruvate/2-oxoacid:ferredoxin oxidoreductase delta subunit
MQSIHSDGLAVQTKHINLNIIKRLGLALLGLGFIFLAITLANISNSQPILFLFLTVGLITIGSIIYIIAQAVEVPAGIKNDHVFFKGISSRGIIGWLLAIIITVFYIILYWFHSYLEHWIRLMDPLAQLIMHQPADQWFLYGTFYTLAVMIMGLRMIVYKYRHNRYHQIRTYSIIFFQLGFAFLIPYFLKGLNQPDFYFSYFWPLKYDYLFPNTVDYLLAQPGGLGFFMIFWGAVMSFIATPVLTYFFGKRWYCSWVCGCGGLANTLGDPWRQLSDKSLRAWKIERWSIHSVLIFITITTIMLWINSATEGKILGGLSQTFAQIYGFLIGAVWAGVIGVGFYTIMGSRVWCRFGCPLAAILGILQKYFSKFRISTNGGQCISCGNCSTYCEMGIDVRWYAQRGQNIIRASCVGCGVCSAVCPRGVLKLENK